MANATVRVQFGDPDGTTTGHLSAEIDARADGLNGGKTAFTPGETVYLLVYASANVTVTELLCSAGSLSRQGSAVVSVTEDLLFEEADTATLGKPARASLTQSAWYGRSLGTLTLQADRMTLKAANRGVGVARVSYETLAQVVALSSPVALNGETDFSILALIKGSAT